METQHKPTLKDEVYQQIVELICNGSIKTGEIITEKQLINHFGISKSPVREALIQLGHDNVLKSIPRCGYQVIQIQAKDIRDLTEVRLYLELGCLQKMVESPDEATLSRLKELNRLRCVKPVEQKDVWSAWDNNVQFHLRLLEGAGNTYALDLLERTLSTCTRAYAQLYYNHRESVISSTSSTHAHERIVAAIEAHDLDGAAALLREDILRMQTDLLPRTLNAIY